MQEACRRIQTQEIGCSGSCIGGILDDFVLQKFGSDSYKHVGTEGADHLFLTLSELNCDNTPVSGASTMSKKSPMKDIEQLLQNREDTGTINLSVTLKVLKCL
ncbi:hypothetical protein SO802_017379 [Lithocarpus litseifolius]|uniref:Uncharacterized protein n=1 Tax=Lithocarpus litseifolius TaxID=425828 RepID=A0AAW2CI52_9ROSI